MFKIELHNRAPEADPAPCFATSTEVAIAEELRHQLERQLLAELTPPPALPVASSDGPGEASGTRNSHGSEQS